MTLLIFDGVIRKIFIKKSEFRYVEYVTWVTVVLKLIKFINRFRLNRIVHSVAPFVDYFERDDMPFSKIRETSLTTFYTESLTQRIGFYFNVKPSNGTFFARHHSALVIGYIWVMYMGEY